MSKGLTIIRDHVLYGEVIPPEMEDLEGEEWFDVTTLGSMYQEATSNLGRWRHRKMHTTVNVNIDNRGPRPIITKIEECHVSFGPWLSGRAPK